MLVNKHLVTLFPAMLPGMLAAIWLIMDPETLLITSNIVGNISESVILMSKLPAISIQVLYTPETHYTSLETLPYIFETLLTSWNVKYSLALRKRTIQQVCPWSLGTDRDKTGTDRDSREKTGT